MTFLLAYVVKSSVKLSHMVCKSPPTFLLFKNICLRLQKALKVSVTVDDICKVIVTNRRAETAPLPEYLLSRSIAGRVAYRINYA